MRRLGGVADPSQHETRTASIQEPRHAGEARQGQIGDGLDREQHRTDPGEIADERNVRGFVGGKCAAGVPRADQGRHPDAEDGQREPRGDLVRPAGQHQEPEDEGEGGSRQHSAQDGEREVSAFGGDREADRRAHQHHALDAQVENPGLLADQLAEGGEEQWGAGAEGRDGNGEEQVEIRHRPCPRHGIAGARGG